MQKRLSEELQVIDLNIKILEDSYFNLGFMLNKLLSAPDKAFEVTFKGVAYDFIYPTTNEEKQAMMHMRKKLLSELFKEVFVQMVDGQNPWEMITAFASGIDTLDMQVEIVGKEEMMTQKDVDGSNLKVALNLENYQVDMQRTEREFDEMDQED